MQGPLVDGRRRGGGRDSQLYAAGGASSKARRGPQTQAAKLAIMRIAIAIDDRHSTADQHRIGHQRHSEPRQSGGEFAASRLARALSVRVALARRRRLAAALPRRRADADAERTLLFVHGNPTWSFHWRRLIAALARRVPLRRAGSPRLRAERPAAATVAVGGSYRQSRAAGRIARPAARHARRPGLGRRHRAGRAARRARAVRADRPVQHRRLSPLVHSVANSRLPRAARWASWRCRAATPSRGRRCTMTLARRRRLDPAVAAGYLAPYDSWARRAAVYQFVRDIPLSPRHPTWQTLGAIEDQLAALADLPSLLVWGERDWCFTTECLDRFAAVWPQAEVTGWPTWATGSSKTPPTTPSGIVDDFLRRTEPMTASLPIRRRRARRCTLGACATLACLWEATAPKPGNVYRGADFDDLTYADFLTSAAVDRPDHRPRRRATASAPRSSPPSPPPAPRSAHEHESRHAAADRPAGGRATDGPLAEASATSSASSPSTTPTTSTPPSASPNPAASARSTKPT